MASIKVKFRPSTVADHEGTIYYQIIHDRKVRQLLTDYHVYPAEWDESRSNVARFKSYDRKLLLTSIRECIRRDTDRLLRIVRLMDDKEIIYSASDVVEEFERYSREYSLFNYMESVIIKLRKNGKVRTSETYTATLRSFKNFLKSRTSDSDILPTDDIMLDCVTSEIMEAYEAWQRQRGLSANSISFYTRILRAVYNRAVEEGITDNRSPFRHVYTGVDKTVKRALPLSVIKRIRLLDLSMSSSLDYARDMFMMSFMLRGMSFIDMAYLKKKDLSDGYLTYRRRKTGQKLTIEWTAEMQAILDKYPANPSDYLLPIIRGTGLNERDTYRNVGYNINRNLKTIARRVGVTIPLTLYVARHSWASAAQSKGIPVSIISEGMGHGSESTTRIYLAGLDTTRVDRANSLILRSL
ncbi:MAG: tyrosine-type recombinase/integrase [Bacteroides sp.]|nr:tyrosine-type recombinase/integrase [Bacteroides sp.]